MSSELVSVKNDLKRASLIILGEVVGKDGNNYLFKLDKWASKELNKTNFIKINSEKELIKFNKYLITLGHLKANEHFVIDDPLRQIYEIKSMGEYDFLVRDYNSDKPMIGQVGLKSTIDYIRKDLDLTIRTRSVTKFERSQTKLIKQNNRKIASVEIITKNESSKLSETWILTFLGLLSLIPFILRKTKF